jgi:hypothetical protein
MMLGGSLLGLLGYASSAHQSVSIRVCRFSLRTSFEVLGTCFEARSKRSRTRSWCGLGLRIKHLTPLALPEPLKALAFIARRDPSDYPGDFVVPLWKHDGTAFNRAPDSLDHGEAKEIRRILRIGLRVECEGSG